MLLAFFTCQLTALALSTLKSEALDLNWFEFSRMHFKCRWPLIISIGGYKNFLTTYLEFSARNL